MPSYTGSQAQSGYGASILIGSTVIGEVTDITQSGKANATDDVTNLNSTAEEFIATLLKPGNWEITMNRVPGDTGQQALKTAFDSKTRDQYTIKLAKTATQTTAGDQYVFNAIVEEMEDISALRVDKKITTKVKLKGSNAITFTAGS